MGKTFRGVEMVKVEKVSWDVEYNDSIEEKDEEDYDVDCSSCGDGGCVHCEPHRFL